MQTGISTRHPLLESLIDYAGLFPPASLPLSEALAEYRALMDRPDSPLLGRFIVPATRLDELSVYLRLFDGRSPLPLCLLAIPGAHATDIGLAVEYAAATGETFVSATGGQCRVDVIETRLTDRELDDSELCTRALKRAAQAAAPHPLYVELPFARRPEDSFAALSLVSLVRSLGLAHVGAKIRCGGDTPEDVPPPEIVAGFLFRCIEQGVPFKATAGLHHLVRTLDGEHGPRHGFLNVFAAAVLGHARRLTFEVLVQIVEETDPASFSLESGGVAWREYSASPAETRRARLAFAHSFGSCSFDEPTADLRAMGWLDEAIPAASPGPPYPVPESRTQTGP